MQNIADENTTISKCMKKNPKNKTLLFFSDGEGCRLLLLSFGSGHYLKMLRFGHKRHPSKTILFRKYMKNSPTVMFFFLVEWKLVGKKNEQQILFLPN